MGINEDEAATLGFTVVVLAGLFIGRYLANIWGRNLDVYPRRLLISLSLLALGLTFWVFFYTEFPLRDRKSISVLLFVLPLFALSTIVGGLVKLVRAVPRFSSFRSQYNY